MFHNPDKFCKKPEGPTLTFEPGRFYRTRDGEKAVIIEKVMTSRADWYGMRKVHSRRWCGIFWNNVGHWEFKGGEHDLVSYWEDELDF